MDEAKAEQAARRRRQNQWLSVYLGTGGMCMVTCAAAVGAAAASVAAGRVATTFHSRYFAFSYL
jgi:hypothetical protein